MKWFPPPSVPHWWAAFLFSASEATAGRFAFSAARSSSAARGWTSERWWNPTGMPRSIEARRRGSLPSSADASSEVRTAAMPQPMSTPTAAGQIAPFVAMTLPTVAPMPQWVSAIAATCLKTKGSAPVRTSCAAAEASTSSVQTLIGTRDARVRRTGIAQPGPAGSFRENRIMRSSQRSGRIVFSGMSVRASHVTR